MTMSNQSTKSMQNEYNDNNRRGQDSRRKSNESVVTAAASAIYADQVNGRQFQVLGAEYGISDFGDAYSVQDELVRMLAERDNTRPVGHKIALASVAVQHKCGLSEPIVGVVLESSVRQDCATITLSDYQHLGIEFEIGFRIKQDLVGTDVPLRGDDIAPVVDAIFPVIDLLDDRYLDYSELHPISLIADNTCSAGAVIGTLSPLRDLHGAVATVTQNEAPLDSTPVQESIGDPLNLVAWLANDLRKRGDYLSTGDIVLSGALFPPVFPAQGETYKYSLSDIGTVSVSFL